MNEKEKDEMEEGRLQWARGGQDARGKREKRKFKILYFGDCARIKYNLRSRYYINPLESELLPPLLTPMDRRT